MIGVIVGCSFPPFPLAFRQYSAVLVRREVRLHVSLQSSKATADNINLKCFTASEAVTLFCMSNERRAFYKLAGAKYTSFGMGVKVHII